MSVILAVSRSIVDHPQKAIILWYYERCPAHNVIKSVTDLFPRTCKATPLTLQAAATVV